MPQHSAPHRAGATRLLPRALVAGGTLAGGISLVLHVLFSGSKNDERGTWQARNVRATTTQRRSEKVDDQGAVSASADAQAGPGEEEAERYTSDHIRRSSTTPGTISRATGLFRGGLRRLRGRRAAAYHVVGNDETKEAKQLQGEETAAEKSRYDVKLLSATFIDPEAVEREKAQVSFRQGQHGFSIRQVVKKNHIFLCLDVKDGDSFFVQADEDSLSLTVTAKRRSYVMRAQNAAEWKALKIKFLQGSKTETEWKAMLAFEAHARLTSKENRSKRSLERSDQENRPIGANPLSDD